MLGFTYRPSDTAAIITHYMKMWVEAGKLQRDMNVLKTTLQSQMTRARKFDCSVNCALRFSTNKSRYLYWKNLGPDEFFQANPLDS